MGAIEITTRSFGTSCTSFPSLPPPPLPPAPPSPSYSTPDLFHRHGIPHHHRQHRQQPRPRRLLHCHPPLHHDRQRCRQHGHRGRRNTQLSGHAINHLRHKRLQQGHISQRQQSASDRGAQISRERYLVCVSGSTGGFFLKPLEIRRSARRQSHARRQSQSLVTSQSLVIVMR